MAAQDNSSIDTQNDPGRQLLRPAGWAWNRIPDHCLCFAYNNIRYPVPAAPKELHA